MAKIEYIRFPLSFLRVLLADHKGDQKKAALDAFNLTGWTAHYMARKQWKEQCEAFQKLIDMEYWFPENPASKVSIEERVAELERSEITALVDEGSLPYHYQSELETARACYSGRGLTFGGNPLSPGSWMMECRIYERWNNAVPDYEHDAWVRLHRNIVSDLVRGNWKWEEFALYCAILSKIGTKVKPVRITYQELIARSSGYRSARLMPPKAKPVLTIAKIRYRLAKWGEGRNLVETFSQEKGRARWYWLPGRIDEQTAMAAIGAYMQKGKQHRTKLELRRAVIDRLTGSQMPPDAPGDDGGIPTPNGPAPAPQTPTTGGAPSVDPAGILSLEGHQWYTRQHLEQSLGDSPELLQMILSEFERVEFGGEVYYSANRRRAIA